MATFKLPPIASLPSLSRDEVDQILDALFEPSANIHGLVEEEIDLSTEHFDSYEAFIEHIKAFLDPEMGRAGEMEEFVDGVLSAHPRLGAKKVDSVQSQAEQAQLNAGGEEEAEKLSELNKEYEDKFDGLHYVTFVNGRSRAEIMEDMRFRIDRDDIDQERIDGINAMCDIAIDRARKLQQA